MLELDRKACDHYLVPLPRTIFEANLVLRSGGAGLSALETLVRIAENGGQPVLAAHATHAASGLAG